MYSLPFSENRFELVTINSLLRYAERPEKVVFEATRVLKYGGIVIIVDFSAHGLSELRDEYGHRWLGFSEIEILTMLGKNNFVMNNPVYFEGEALTVCIWVGVKQTLKVI
jgi:ArsR family transcriptional regulator